MAELVLTTVASRLAARAVPAALRPLAKALAVSAAGAVGRGIDQRLFGSPRLRQGPQLNELRVQGASEGTPLSRVFGRVRLAGQVIWAARLKQRTETTRTGGGKSGPEVRTTRTVYSLSFAVALAEGPIAGIGQVWANGTPLDLSTKAHRLYLGSETQDPDPLIEAIEGAANSPAYRGVAYVVFEDLPLGPFGDAVPQLTFEVLAAPAPSPDSLEARAKAVCLIPGSGGAVYATTKHTRIDGPGQHTPLNQHLDANRSDIEVSLDQLSRDLPNVRAVTVAIGWFGTDLRAEHCQIKPGIDTPEALISPVPWSVAGQTAQTAHLISRNGQTPAYGASPSDHSVIELITALKARGYKVGLHPFVQMDIAAGSGLPNPNGGGTQAPYPWRGRIAPAGPVAPAVAAFFGTARASHFRPTPGAVSYTGPGTWGYNRFVLHLAALAEAAGGVDWLLIGSELRGLTTAAAGPGSYPAVDALRALAQDVRTLLRAGTKLTYGADWSEYFGHQPADGSGVVRYCLDPLWADPAIDAIGVDWYPPLADWREGNHLDAQDATGPYDQTALMARIEGGEGYDWYYASSADRLAQIRTSIADGAHGKPWVYRHKDLRAFWANRHCDRVGGAEVQTPSPWLPQSKPIWLMELGCAAVDKGANAPNLFIDPKSSESFLPPFSRGTRDDLIQRALLEAYLRYWQDPARNPVSSVTGQRMIDPDMMHLWCWDARPYPAFPARTEVWADGPAWRLGHWLNGRAGQAQLGQVIAALCAAGGVDAVDTSAVSGVVDGFEVPGASSPRAALEVLCLAYGVEVVERDGVLRFFQPSAGEVRHPLSSDQTLAGPDGISQRRADPATQPSEVHVRFLDPDRGQGVASVSARALGPGRAAPVVVDAPLVLAEAEAVSLAERVLARSAANGGVALAVADDGTAPPLGGLIAFSGAGVSGLYRVERRALGGGEVSLSLHRADQTLAGNRAGAVPSAPAPPEVASPAEVVVMDLPPLPGQHDDARPLVAAYAAPWRGPVEVWHGGRQAAVLDTPAVIARLASDLRPGPVWRWDNAAVLEVTAPLSPGTSVSPGEALELANLFALEHAGGWELLAVQRVELVGAGRYRLSRILRGLMGSEALAQTLVPAGARLVRLDLRVVRLDLPDSAMEGEIALSLRQDGVAGNRGLNASAERRALRPLAPVRVRCARDGDGSLLVFWLRRSRSASDPWGGGEVPLAEASEAYTISLVAGGAVRASQTVTTPSARFSATEHATAAGFGPVRVRIAQLSDALGPGLAAESLVTV